MKILFLSRSRWPSVGGVELHIKNLVKSLKVHGVKISLITEDDIKYPKVKIIGLLYIWWWIFRNRKLILGSDLVHVHDVAVWYLPFRFLYPRKSMFLTIHGWEGTWPIPYLNILIKRLSKRIANKTIIVGNYIKKYYGVSGDVVIYGAVSMNRKIEMNRGSVKKIKNKVVFLGRLEKDTGILRFLKELDKYKHWDVEFVGDGEFRKECEKYGKVHGFTDPTPFLKKAEYVVPGGYLAYIEAKAYGCKIITYADNPLKQDYWRAIKKIKKFPTWDELADIYLDLWKSSLI